MKNFDLEERTYRFAKNVALFCKKLPRTISNIEYIKQLLKASASVAANYIEANEALSKKENFFFNSRKIKIKIPAL